MIPLWLKFRLPPVKDRAMWRVARLALRAIENNLGLETRASEHYWPPGEPELYEWASRPAKVEAVFAIVGGRSVPQERTGGKLPSRSSSR